MGTVRKIGDEYYIEFLARGLLYQQKAGKDLGAAEKLLNDTEEKIRRGEMGVVVRDVEVDVFLKTFLGRTRPGHTPRTHARYEEAVKHFETFCGTVLSKDGEKIIVDDSLPGFSASTDQYNLLRGKLSAVTPGIIEEYRAFLIRSRCVKTGRRLKPKVINFTFYLLRDILDFAVKLGFLNDNPTLHARLLKVSQRKSPRVLVRENVQKLYDHASDDWKVYIDVILGAGLRVEEIIELKWTEVDFQNKCFKIEHRLAPGNDRSAIRIIPMDVGLFETMRHLQEKRKSYEGYVFHDARGCPLKQEQLVKDFARLVEESDLEPAVNFRCLRDTFVRNVLQKGVSLIRLSKLLGLSDIARVMRYEGLVDGDRIGGRTDLSGF